MLDLNSDTNTFFFIFFSKEPRNNALVEKIIDKITKTKKIKAILLNDIFKVKIGLILVFSYFSLKKCFYLVTHFKKCQTCHCH